MSKNTGSMGNASKVTKGLSIGIGSALVAVTGGLAFLGGRAVVNAMDNDAHDQLQSQIAVLTEQRKAAETTPEPTEAPVDLWPSQQLDWARSEHVRWNEDHFPVRENGEVIDDPTTLVNEQLEYAALLAERSAPEATPTPTPEPTPTPAPPRFGWWADNDMINVDEDGRLYYVVKDGDTLDWIAAQTGFTVEELAAYNGLKPPYELKAGQRIYFPPDGPGSTIDTSVGLG